MKDVAISSVEDETFWSFSKRNEKISRKTITKVIIKIYDVVKNAIELKLAERGSILHDGWISMSMHYIFLPPI